MILYYNFPYCDNLIDINCYKHEVIPNDENKSHLIYFNKDQAQDFNYKMRAINNVVASATPHHPVLCRNIFYTEEDGRAFLKNKLIKDIIE
jgi:hypothetical protein